MDLIPHFDKTNYSKTIIAGDFNGASPLWGYNDTNPTGRFIESFCNITNLFVMQDCESSPTHFHRVHKTLSRPDLTLVSADLMTKVSTEVKDGIGTSDHFPTFVKLETPERKKQKKWTRWNFKKAQWDKFKATSDRLLQDVDLTDQDIDHMNKDVTDAILSAAQQCIPRGCRATYKPFWNKNITSNVEKRETARRKFMKSNTTENRIAYNKASSISKREILTAKREKFHSTCKNLDLS